MIELFMMFSMVVSFWLGYLYKKTKVAHTIAQSFRAGWISKENQLRAMRAFDENGGKYD